MYYDYRDLAAAATLKKIRKHVTVPKLADHVFNMSCATIVSFFLVNEETPARSDDDINQQIGHIIEFANSFQLKVTPRVLNAIYSPVIRVLDNLPTEDIRYFANYVLDLLLSEQENIDYRHCKIVAGFAGQLFSHLRSDVVDLFPNTAELSLGVLGRAPRRSFPMSADIAQQHRALVELKLQTNNIQPNFVHDLADFRIHGSRAACLIDSPSQASSATTHLDILSGATSEDIYFALSQVHGKQGKFILTRTYTGVISAQANEKWQQLNDHEKIESVVAFDSYYQGKPRKFVIIVIDNTRAAADKPVYINVTENPALASLDAIERSMLAASIYLMWLGQPISPEKYTPRIATILNSQFKNGYRDVDGLCKQVARDELTARNTFRVNQHVDFGAAEHKRIDVNGDEIVALIAKENPRSIYVIGNNGAGKSLLLGDIASKLLNNEIRTVGITLSQSNRFPKVTQENQDYYQTCGSSYLSARSKFRKSEIILAALDTIFRDQLKIDTLIECMGLLKFKAQMYLAPRSHSKSERMAHESDAMIALSTDAAENIAELEQLHLEIYTLALSKDNESHLSKDNRYLLFTDLSSGEQNILLLLAHIIETAQVDTHTIVLLDEPEVSLHVSWQQTLPKILNTLAERLSVSFITATHAPVLITNAPVTDTPCYVLDAGKLTLIPPARRHSVETILVAGFNTYTPHNREVYERCAQLVAAVIKLKNEQAPPAEFSFESAIEQLAALKNTMNNSDMDKQDSRFLRDMELIKTAHSAITSAKEEVVSND
ncbi:AAA family ATPase [Pseudomonas alkylphenolica]|uniref:AAA family ATPase n=1 Tax=Pseudomonas alkylphenolica TaxID=237609 RepID=A0A6I6H8V1_9PSED|nr:AAA family ATPase [Pseudomonas alkylphenolica]QGW77038.1 AAA family ATPase [Pseudomonas alkylphenolica]